jgi:hypothetical protein
LVAPRPTPIPEDQASVFISPRGRVATHFSRLLRHAWVTDWTTELYVPTSVYRLKHLKECRRHNFFPELLYCCILKIRWKHNWSWLSLVVVSDEETFCIWYKFEWNISFPFLND